LTTIPPEEGFWKGRVKRERSTNVNAVPIRALPTDVRSPLDEVTGYPVIWVDLDQIGLHHIA